MGTFLSWMTVFAIRLAGDAAGQLVRRPKRSGALPMNIVRAPRLATRCLGLLSASLLGLALFLACWQGAAAQAPAGLSPSGAARPAASTIWHVNLFPGEGLVGYWKFDQVSGTTTLNSARLGNAASLFVGASLTTTNLPPKVTMPNFGALAVNGSPPAAVLVVDDSVLNVPTTTFSLAAWVRRVITGTGDTIYDSGSQTNHWFFGLLADDTLALTTNGAADYRSSFVITDTNWHHVAAVISGTAAGNLTIYLDGLPAAPLTATIANAPSGPKHIGNKLTLNTPFKGQIDEVRLYNRSLSALEIGRLAVGRGCAVDGLDWPTAFADLQCALDVAHSGDEIWVGTNLNDFRPGTARAASYHLVSGVGLYGGFVGFETTRAQRPVLDFSNASLHSLLTGDLFGNDGAGQLADNALHVVDGSGSGPGTVFDGFLVHRGAATGASADDQNGGGLLIGSGAPPRVANDLFQANSAASNGGGAYAAGDLVLTNVLFDNNIAVGSGGGAYAGSRAAVTGGSFTNNRGTTFYGGGLYAGVSAALTATQFISNLARFGGGGAAVAFTATVSGGYFERNAVTVFDGGGLSAFVAVLTDTQFFSNTAVRGGAGASLINGATVRGGLFQNNRATDTLFPDSAPGGALVVQGGPVNISGTTFISNTSTGDGGALGLPAFVSSSLVITNATFISNTARNGGAIRSNAPVTATGVIFTGNTASSTVGLGGGMLVSATWRLEDLRFEGNSAAEGGGLWAIGVGQVDRAAFLANRAVVTDGGGLKVQGAGSVWNALFVGNSAAGHGGALAVLDAGFSAVNISADQNTAVLTGSVLFAQSSGVGVRNSVIWNNAPGALGHTAAGLGVTYSVGDFGLVGAGNRASDPLLVREPDPGDGQWATLADNDYGDLRLQLGSPGLDSGDNSQVSAQLDLDRLPRRVDIPSVPDSGLGTAPLVDMGAYEFQVLELFLPLVER